MPASAVTPVTVLTGFLGSGKSTLLNRMLATAALADTAVIVNEWGDIAIDHALVRAGSENIVVLAGGCICCRVAGDVVRGLRELHFERADGRVPAFSRVVIETSGLADPAPLLATLVELPLVAARYALSGVVATVDAEHGMASLDAHAEALKQAAMADRLVITKCDRAAEPAIAALEARLATLNPGATRVRSPDPGLDLAALLQSGLYRGAGRTMDAAGWLQAGRYRDFSQPSTAIHDASIRSFSWHAAEPQAWEDVETALETLLELLGDRILRMKGLIHVAGEPGPRAVHAVHHTLYPSARLPQWPDDDRASRLVFIGRDLEPAPVDTLLRSFFEQSTRGQPWQHPSTRT